MTHILLSTEAFSVVTQGVAGYVFYIRAIGYALAAVICVVGSLSVYSDMVAGESEVRMKMMRLAFSCVFLISASTALPMFFGIDSTSNTLSYTSSIPSGGGSVRGDIFSIDDLHPLHPYIIDPVYPGGHSPIIWTRDDGRSLDPSGGLSGRQRFLNIF